MAHQLWEDLLVGRLLPSITSTLTALLVVLLAIKLFRVRNPETRYILFHLPLIKGLLVLVRGVPPPVPGTEGRFRLGVQLLDPLSLISMPSYRSRFPDLGVELTDLRLQWDREMLELALVVAVGVALGLLVYRWVALAIFYRRLLSLPAAERETDPRLFGILDRLVANSGVPYPRVLLVDNPPIGPCTVGVAAATVVLPVQLLQQLDERQLEAVLAHELAHVSRRDGLLHWPSLLLRDLLAFNPVAHRLFDRLLVEREKDSDRRAAMMTGQPRELAKALVEVALLARGAKLQPAPGSVFLRQSLLGRTPVVEERVGALLKGPIPSSRWRSVGLALLFLYLILVRVYVGFPIAGQAVGLE